MQSPGELEELRVGLDRIRTLLENLAVRGLRACGPDELSQIASFAEYLDQSGAGHLSAALTDLQHQIEKDQRSSAQTLLQTQTYVRLLERLLTLRVVREYYATAIETVDSETPENSIPTLQRSELSEDDEDEGDEEEDADEE